MFKMRKGDSITLTERKKSELPRPKKKPQLKLGEKYRVWFINGDSIFLKFNYLNNDELIQIRRCSWEENLKVGDTIKPKQFSHAFDGKDITNVYYTRGIIRRKEFVLSFYETEMSWA